MAITNYYVDPAIAGDSGTGTSGDPFGDLQYGLDTVTRDSTNGDQFNIKAGTDEILAAALSLTTYGTPTSSTPLILRGYTAAAGDGGVGGIDCNDATMFAAATLDYIVLMDLHIHNGGAADIVNLDDYITVINCEVNNTTGSGIKLDVASRVIGCYVHDCGNRGIICGIRGNIFGNYLANGTNDFDRAIAPGDGSVVEFNIINIDGASDGIIPVGPATTLRNNTIYSTSGTGEAINNISDLTNIVANYIEGFSGVGGDGIQSTAVLNIYVANRFYNNTNNESISANVINGSDNSALSASGLVDPANGDFRAMVSLRAGAWPATFPEIDLPQYLDIGAVQRRERYKQIRSVTHGVV